MPVEVTSMQYAVVPWSKW